MQRGIELPRPWRGTRALESRYENLRMRCMTSIKTGIFKLSKDLGGGFVLLSRLPNKAQEQGTAMRFPRTASKDSMDGEVTEQASLQERRRTSDISGLVIVPRPVSESSRVVIDTCQNLPSPEGILLLPPLLRQASSLSMVSSAMSWWFPENEYGRPSHVS